MLQVFVYFQSTHVADISVVKALRRNVLLKYLVVVTSLDACALAALAILTKDVDDGDQNPFRPVKHSTVDPMPKNIFSNYVILMCR